MRIINSDTIFPSKKDTNFAGSILESYFVLEYLHTEKGVPVSDFGIGRANYMMCVEKRTV